MRARVAWLLVVIMIAAAVPIVNAMHCCCDVSAGTGQQDQTNNACPAGYPDQVEVSDVSQSCLGGSSPLCRSAAPQTIGCELTASGIKANSVMGVGLQGRAVMKVTYALASTGCANKLLYISIDRCYDKNAATICDRAGETTDPGQFDDAGIKDGNSLFLWNQVYKYRVSVHYPNGAVSEPVEGTGNLGDLECLDVLSTNQFCIGLSHFQQQNRLAYLQKNGYGVVPASGFSNPSSQTFKDNVGRAFRTTIDSKATCTETNHVSAVRCTGQTPVCFKKIGSSATCVAKSDCEAKMTGAFDLQTDRQSCEFVSPEFTVPSYCYLDRGSSLSDVCKACTANMICYSYKSQDACESNGCGVGDCLWTPLQGLEALGVGVCKEDHQNNCQFCGVGPADESYNDIFDVCSEQKAQALSTEPPNMCFFSQDATGHSTAITCDQADCTTFKTEKQCDGDIPTSVTLDNNNALATWNENNACGIKVCEWIDGVCHKNADGGDPHNFQTLADCPDNTPECERDYFPPKTVAEVHAENGVATFIGFRVSDQTTKPAPASPVKLTKNQPDITSKTIKCSDGPQFDALYNLWFCVQVPGQTKCNDRSKWHQTPGTLLCLADGVLTNNLQQASQPFETLANGTYEMSYFAEDPAYNQETPIKKFSFVTCEKCHGPMVTVVNVSPANLYNLLYYTNAGKSSSQELKITVTLSKNAQLLDVTLLRGSTAVPVKVAPATAYNKVFVIVPDKASLEEGQYTLSLGAHDEENVVTPATEIVGFVIDTTPPVLTIQPAEGGFINTTTPEINVSANEPVRLASLNLTQRQLTGSTNDYCGFFQEKIENIVPSMLTYSSAPATTFKFKLGDNKVPKMDGGKKRINAAATDLAGNVGSGQSNFASTYGGPYIGLKQPKFGVSSSTPFTFTIEISEPGECRYSDLPIGYTSYSQFFATAASPDGYEHRKDSYAGLRDQQTKRLYLWCKDEDDNYAQKDCNLKVDSTAPTLTTSAYPDPVVQTPLSTTLTVQGSDPIYCKYKELTSQNDASWQSIGTYTLEFPGFGVVPSTTKQVDVILPDTAITKSVQWYGIACYNDAQLGPVFTRLPVRVDLNQALSVTSTTPVTFNMTTIDVSVQTNKKANCNVVQAADELPMSPSPDGFSHVIRLQGMPVGHDVINVSCYVAIGQTSQEASTLINVLVDNSGPKMTLVSDESDLPWNREQTFYRDRLRSDWNAVDDNSDVTAYFYTLKEKKQNGEVVIDCSSDAKAALAPGACDILPPTDRPFYLTVAESGSPFTLTDGLTYWLTVQPRNQVGLLGLPNSSNGVRINSSQLPLHCRNGAADYDLYETDVDCGGECLGCANGKKCTMDDDCTSGYCDPDQQICMVRPLCKNGLKDTKETDVDCGGSSASNCTGCVNEKLCLKNADCISNWCVKSAIDGKLRCDAPPQCHDGSMDGNETDVDCGGNECQSTCQAGENCTIKLDCYDGLICDATACRQPSMCENNIKDTNETAIDCGGGNKTGCSGCANGLACNNKVDCASNYCINGKCQDPPYCLDEHKDGNESDTDCGGVCTAKCPLNATCNTAADCTSNFCENNRCVFKGPCDDRALNFNETDVDCGGSQCGKCGAGRICKLNTDCQSALCQSNGTKLVCATPAACTDKILNGNETDKDCGDGCFGCSIGYLCKVDKDCQNGLWCIAGTNGTRCGIRDHCENSIKDLGETGIDCGGSCPKACGVTGQCLTLADCASGTCTGNICTNADPCTNGKTDGTETDIDCGGSCSKCGDGKACKSDLDCQTGLVCASGVCKKCGIGEAGCGKPGDADGDGVPDDTDKCPGTPTGAVVDVDGCSREQKHSCDDVIPDSWRFKNGFVKGGDTIDCTGDAIGNADPDADGLTNIDEYKKNTDPHNADSDSDGWSDGDEVKAGTDPNDPNSHPTSWFWIWLIIILLLAALVGGYFGYVEYRKKHPEKFKNKPMPLQGLPSDMMKKLQEARARVAQRFAPKAPAKKPEARPEVKPGKAEQKEEFVPLEKLGKGKESSEFQRLKALENRQPGVPLKGKPLPAAEEDVFASLSGIALQNMSAKERKELLRKLKLLRLGKLSTKEIDELMKQLRITGQYYAKHKDDLEREVEAFTSGKSMEEVRLKEIVKKRKK